MSFPKPTDDKVTPFSSRCEIKNWKFKFIITFFIIIAICLIYIKPVLSLQYISELKWPLLILIVLLLYKNEIAFIIKYKLSALTIFGMEIKFKLENQDKLVEFTLRDSQIPLNNININGDLAKCYKELQFERICNVILGSQLRLLQSLCNANKSYLGVFAWYQSEQNIYPKPDKIGIFDLLNFLIKMKLIEELNTDIKDTKIYKLTDYGNEFLGYVETFYPHKLELL